MPSLTTYRRTVAPLLGEYEQGTADAGASTSILGCATALQSGARVRSTVLPASYFKGKWLFRPQVAVGGNDRDRLIATYDPTAGYLYPDEPWTVSPGGETFEITSLFSGTDLNTLVNEGLTRCYVVVDATFTVLDNQTTRHDLTAVFPWLEDERHVYQVGELATGELRTRTDPFARTRRGEVRADGTGTIYLEDWSFPTTSTVYVRAIKQAYFHCRPALGTYGAQSGLSLETDEAPVDATWLAWAAILAAADRLDHLESTGQATADAMRSRQMAAARFSLLTHEHLRLPRRTTEPLTWIGASYPGRRGGVRW